MASHGRLGIVCANLSGDSRAPPLAMIPSGRASLMQESRNGSSVYWSLPHFAHVTIRAPAVQCGDQKLHLEDPNGKIPIRLLSEVQKLYIEQFDVLQVDAFRLVLAKAEQSA